MRPFWKCSFVIKTLVGKNLKFYPLQKNWGLVSILGPVSPKSKNPHKFTSFNFLMVNEIFLEISYCQQDFGKNKIDILPILEELGPYFHI